MMDEIDFKNIDIHNIQWHGESHWLKWFYTFYWNAIKLFLTSFNFQLPTSNVWLLFIIFDWLLYTFVRFRGNVTAKPIINWFIDEKMTEWSVEFRLRIISLFNMKSNWCLNIRSTFYFIIIIFFYWNDENDEHYFDLNWPLYIQLYIVILCPAMMW